MRENQETREKSGDFFWKISGFLAGIFQKEINVTDKKEQ